MSELFDKSIRTLELPRVLQLLADQAVSEEAKALALAVRPETDYEDVLRLLDQTDGARTMSAPIVLQPVHAVPSCTSPPLVMTSFFHSIEVVMICRRSPNSTEPFHSSLHVR